MGATEFFNLINKVSNFVDSKLMAVEFEIYTTLDRGNIGFIKFLLDIKELVGPGLDNFLFPLGPRPHFGISEFVFVLLVTAPLWLILVWALFRSLYVEGPVVVPPFKLDLRFILIPVLLITVFTSPFVIEGFWAAPVSFLLMVASILCIQYMPPQMVDVPPLHFRPYIVMATGVAPLAVLVPQWLVDHRGMSLLSGGDPTLGIFAVASPILLFLVWAWARTLSVGFDKKITLTNPSRINFGELVLVLVPLSFIPLSIFFFKSYVAMLAVLLLVVFLALAPFKISIPHTALTASVVLGSAIVALVFSLLRVSKGALASTFIFSCNPLFLSFGIVSSIVLIFLALLLTNFKKEDIYLITSKEEHIFNILTLATLISTVSSGKNFLLPIITN